MPSAWHNKPGIWCPVHGVTNLESDAQCMAYILARCPRSVRRVRMRMRPICSRPPGPFTTWVSEASHTAFRWSWNKKQIKISNVMTLMSHNYVCMTHFNWLGKHFLWYRYEVLRERMNSIERPIICRVVKNHKAPSIAEWKISTGTTIRKE